ncbi:hypothetical protein V3W47_12905 [Deinococcus sp. YIM 134068]|uniref:hypothetical protein n=1 Tax=Deinococcus lichenicola TaxID=3118910 RepID=UPI002F92BE03
MTQRDMRPDAKEARAFEGVLEAAFRITGRGWVLAVGSHSGVLRVGDAVRLEHPDHPAQVVRVAGLEIVARRGPELPSQTAFLIRDWPADLPPPSWLGATVTLHPS